MSALGSPSPLFLASAAADAAAGPIKSVRFNSSDSAHLTRSNPNEGSQRKFTFSFWVKRSKLGANSSVFFAGPSPNSAKGLEVRFDSNDRLYVETYATSSVSKKVITNRVFRDPSAWYHIVLAFDSTLSTENDRLIIYVNGEQIDSSDLSTNNQVAQNFDYRYVGESNADHWIGLAKDNNGTKVNYFNGYLTDFYFIDGAQKDETDFGEFDDNGVWRAIDASGLTFGSNGYHLFDFANESTVGHDSSGNEDDWTANNISTTAGAGNDVLFDVPTNGTQSATGAGGEVSGNYATWNPLIPTTYTLANGNLDASFASGSSNLLLGTIGVSSGKWYWELTINSGSVAMIGIADFDLSIGSQIYTQAGALYYYQSGGSLYGGLGRTSIANAESYGSGYTTGDVVGVALDMDSSPTTLVFYKNGVSQGTATNATMAGKVVGPAYGNGGGATNVSTNWGQRAFAYSAPSGYKALCTTNLSTPTIADGSDYFDTKLYDGTGAAQTISGLSFSPDLAWLKRRSSAESHTLFDTVRGAGKELVSDSTSAEYDAGTGSSGSLIAFNSDGFDLGTRSSVNGSSTTNVAWAWDAGSSTVSNTDGSITASVRANQTAGFSIATVTYGSNVNETYGHGLNAPPEFVISKNRDSSGSWYCYHKALGKDKYIRLNTTNAAGSLANSWGTADPTSSVMGLRSGLSFANGNSSVIYAFTSVKDYSLASSYQANGSDNGTFVYCGFRPKFIIIKGADYSTDWLMVDTSRDPDNPATEPLFPNRSYYEGQASTSFKVDILSNGFKFRHGDSNAEGYNYITNPTHIFYAVAENPFQANGGLAR